MPFSYINENLKDSGSALLYKDIALALSSNFGNIAYVSPQGRNDVATVGQIDKPYQTIQAAINALPAGGTAYIFAGTYSEALIVKRSVTLYFYGATLQNLAANATHTINFIDEGGVSNRYNYLDIKGFGKIIRSGGTAGACAVKVDFLYNTDLTVDGVDIVCANATAFSFQKGRNLYLSNSKVTISGTGHCLYLFEQFNGNLYQVEHSTLKADADACLNLNGAGNRFVFRDTTLQSSNLVITNGSGLYILEGCTLESLTNSVITGSRNRIRAINSKFVGNLYVVDGENIGTFFYQNCELISKTAYPLRLKIDTANSSSFQTELNNCRLIGHSLAAAIFQYIDPFGDNSVSLVNCVGNLSLPANIYQGIIHNYHYNTDLKEMIF